MNADLLKRELPAAIGESFDSSTPPVLMDYQREWLADASPLKIAEKSRRIGLTWAEAADDVSIAARRRSDGGQNVFYIGYNMDMAIEFIDACAMWARCLSLVVSAVEPGVEVFKSDGGEKEIKTYTIRFPNSGFRITALSSRPANLRGKQGVVVIDEAAFHMQLDELLKAALALLIWGGRVRVLSTHNGDSNPFNELIQEIRAGKRAGSVHRTTFKEAVAVGLYKRVCLRLGKPWSADAEAAWVESVYAYYGSAASEELDVIPSAGSGIGLTRALIEAAMTDDGVVARWSEPAEFTMLPEESRRAAALEFCEREIAPVLARLPKHCKNHVGGDFARVGDTSVLVPIVVTEHMVKRVPLIVEMRGIPYDQQRQVCFYLIEHLPRFISAAFDARGNGGYLAEVAAQRFGATRVAQVQITEGWYRDHMPRVVTHFEDRSIQIPRHVDLVDDFRQLVKVRGVYRVPDDARTKGSDGGQRHADSVIGTAMALFAEATLDAAPIDYQSTGARPTRGLFADFAGESARHVGDAGFGTVLGSRDFGGY